MHWHLHIPYWGRVSLHFFLYISSAFVIANIYWCFPVIDLNIYVFVYLYLHTATEGLLNLNKSQINANTVLPPQHWKLVQIGSAHVKWCNSLSILWVVLSRVLMPPRCRSDIGGSGCPALGTDPVFYWAGCRTGHAKIGAQRWASTKTCNADLITCFC